MSFRGILHRVSELRDAMAGLNEDVDNFDRALSDVERRGAEVPVFLVGPDGRPIGGGSGQSGVRSPFSPTSGASSVASISPSGGGLAQSFAGATAGSNRSSGGAGGGAGGRSAGKSRGVKREQTAAEAIAAIVAAAGVQTPPKDSWDPTGTSDGTRGGQVIQYVVANGINSPREYLVWCAGWLAYVAPTGTATAASKGSPVGKGGPRPLGGKRPSWRDNPLANPVFLGGEAPPGFSGGGGGGGGGGWADSAFNNFGGGGSWEGSSNFDTLVSTTGKVTDAVTESGGQVVGAIRDLTREVQRGNSSTGLRAGGVL